MSMLCSAAFVTDAASFPISKQKVLFLKQTQNIW